MEVRKDEQQRDHFSFTMLTINATDHPLMSRFHGPEDEKRSVIVVDPSCYDAWLDVQSDRDIVDFLKGLPATDFSARSAPRTGRRTPIQQSLL